MILLKKKAAIKLFTGVALIGGAFSPIIASAATSDSTVEATVNSVISVTSAGTVPISVTPTSSGATATATDTVTIDSNDADGYNLTLKDADATLSMTGSQGGSIAATSGTYATPTALSANTWGYRLSDFAAADTYAGITSTEQNIASTTAVSTSGGDTVNVTYGVNVDTSIPAGVYTDAVTYTATVK